jgi:hypothetical protein
MIGMMNIRVLQAKRTTISTGLEYEALKPETSEGIKREVVEDRPENNS